MAIGNDRTISHFAALRALLACLLVAAIALTSFTGAHSTRAAAPATHTKVKATINIGTKLFAEEYLLGDMYFLLLQKNGFNPKLHKLGETPVLQAAILRGDIDMYPEYTGTGLQTLGITKIVTNAAQAYRTVSTGYKKKYHLTWLNQSPMNDTNGVAVTQATASKYHLRTLSDLAKVASQLNFAGLPACKDRPDCLAGMNKAYGINFKGTQYLTSQPLIYSALKSGQADVIEVFTTDGPIRANHLVVLTDNKHKVFPVDRVAPIVRNSILKKYPKIRTILNRLVPYITTKNMIALNEQAVLQAKDPMVVARAFLRSKHLI